MHVSAIDAPSDTYGAVSDVSRPLVYKLNQASMQRSTYIALHALLSWALVTLEGGVQADLVTHEAHTGRTLVEATVVVAEPEVPTETAPEALLVLAEGNAEPEVPAQATEPANAAPDEIVPLTTEMLAESAEDLALEAEVLVETAKVEAPVEVVAEVKPAPKKIAKPV